MPKINVYLPDELAEAVKESGVPVSAICQRALEHAVRRVTAIRETLVCFDPAEPGAGLERFTARARAVLKIATEQARQAGAPAVGTEHLLSGMLAEGTNLALHVMRAMEIEPELVRRALDRELPADTERPAAADEDGPRFGDQAANALELTVAEAHALGHNYVGCEHMLLGLVAEPDGPAGRVLRSLGAEPRLTRRAVSAALAGYVHLRSQTQGTGPGPAAAATGGQAVPPEAAAMVSAAVRKELQPLADRLTRLEQHVGLATD
jgi:ATP-dependent Clp protease ATP-binding subunit ClpA